MLTAIFVILFLLVLGKMISLAFKLTWGIAKVVIRIIILPIAVIGLFLAGFAFIAIPVLIIAGIVLLLVPKKL